RAMRVRVDLGLQLERLGGNRRVRELSLPRAGHSALALHVPEDLDAGGAAKVFERTDKTVRHAVERAVEGEAGEIQRGAVRVGEDRAPRLAVGRAADERQRANDDV